MTDPLSIIALSLTGLHGCVKAMVIIGKAQSYTQNVSDAQFRTTLILHSLTTWAREAGLIQDPPTLRVNAIDAPLVPQILSRIEALFADINKLQRLYGSHLQVTEDEIDELDGETLISVDDDSQRRRWVDRVDISIFLKRSQPWKRLRWVAIDDQKFSRLLGEAKGYVSELGVFLEQARRQRMECQFEFILRNSVLHSVGRQLEIIQKDCQTPNDMAISAAAKLKRTRLAFEKLEVDDTSQPGIASQLSVSPPAHELTHMTSCRQDNMRLSMRRLTLGRAARARRYRTLAQYDGQTVLLEWKYVAQIGDLAIRNRVNQVATLLHQAGPNLHGLRCRGFVVDPKDKRYGYIFDLPAESESRAVLSSSPGPKVGNVPSCSIELQSLRSVFHQQTMPSLNTRLAVAVKLLETLLNLHTSGWLHKELRSDNILLLQEREGGGGRGFGLSASRVFVAGYVCSRLDGPGEVTEPLQFEREADLYRHPMLLSNTHQPYRKGYDIFSVGCTLLEIGLWSSLSNIFETHVVLNPKSPQRRMTETSLKMTSVSLSSTSSQGRCSTDLMALRHRFLASCSLEEGKRASCEASQSDIIDALRFAMGNRYTSIVTELLTADRGIVEPSTSEHDDVLDLEMRARDEVRAIAEAM